MRIPLRWILLAATVAFSLAARAQDYPSKPIKIVVPYPAGGGADFMGRMVARVLHEKLGQPTIVENRVGSGGNIGTEYVTRANPDGYTLLFVAPGPVVVNKSLFGNLGFDPDTLVPVALVAAVTNVLAVRPKLGVDNVQQLIALAKSNPGKLNYATQAIGSIAHLTAELFQSKAGIKIVHIPYKGAAPAISDLIGGQVDMAILELSVVHPFARTGKLRMLAVVNEKRNPSVPDVPSMSETLPGVVSTAWYGVLAPPKTPSAIVSKLSATIGEALKQPDLVRQVRERNVEVAVSTPEETALLLKEERERYGNLIRATGMSAQ